MRIIYTPIFPPIIWPILKSYFGTLSPPFVKCLQFLLSRSFNQEWNLLCDLCLGGITAASLSPKVATVVGHMGEFVRFTVLLTFASPEFAAGARLMASTGSCFEDVIGTRLRGCEHASSDGGEDEEEVGFHFGLCWQEIWYSIFIVNVFVWVEWNLYKY